MESETAIPGASTRYSRRALRSSRHNSTPGRCHDEHPQHTPTSVATIANGLSTGSPQIWRGSSQVPIKIHFSIIVTLFSTGIWPILASGELSTRRNILHRNALGHHILLREGWPVYSPQHTTRHGLPNEENPAADRCLQNILSRYAEMCCAPAGVAPSFNRACWHASCFDPVRVGSDYRKRGSDAGTRNNYFARNRLRSHGRALRAREVPPDEAKV